MKQFLLITLIGFLFASCGVIDRTKNNTKTKGYVDSLVVEKENVVIERKVDTVVFTQRITDTVFVELHDTIVKTIVDNSAIKVQLQKVKDRYKVITEAKPQEVQVQVDERIETNSYKKTELEKKDKEVVKDKVVEKKPNNIITLFSLIGGIISILFILYVIFEVLQFLRRYF